MNWSQISLYLNSMILFINNPHYQTYINNLYKANIILKGFINIIKKNYSIKKYNNDLKKLRYKIKISKIPDDLIIILKNMTSIFNCLSTDDLSEILVNCFKIFPLTETELQKFSIWQQTYEYDTGIHSFTTTIFWICAIQSIIELENKLIQECIISY